MSTYLDKHLATKVNPPQSQPLDSRQVKNSAGGYGYAIDSFARLRRFLILGSEGGTFYAGENKLTLENIKCVEECIAQNGVLTVDAIVAISVDGRAPKNDQAVFALALCIANGDETTKQYALKHLDKVCRTGTHLFQIVEFLTKLEVNLSARAKRRALADWYNSKTPDQVAYQAVKYRQRGGWSHRDVLRVAHPKAIDGQHAHLYEWITKGSASDKTMMLPKIVWGYEQAQKSESVGETAALIRNYNLPREAVKTEHLTSPEVWQALLDTGMPATALIRNLGTMTRIGMFKNFTNLDKVELTLLESDALSKARVHPMNILFALKTYASGGGWRSNKTWVPVQKIVDILDAAFYKAFGNVEPTGKNTLLALDVSGSMSAPIMNTSLTCREASAAMALVTQAVEKNVEVVGFTSSGGYWRDNSELTPLNVSARRRLDDVVRDISRLEFGGTDCSLPMLWAKETRRKIDTFVIYTDNETWAGKTHPVKALKSYRNSSGIDAKLVVVGMTSTGFSIADPQDKGMLDVVGFDSATPQIITDFSLGRI